jgi:SAM-dependent methyltransferase
MLCDSCRHVFVDGYFDDATLRVIFSHTQENQKVGFQIEQQRVVSSKIIEKVIQYKTEGCWLDVGFGNGSLLFTALEYGFKPVGVDLRTDSVKAMQALGIESYCEKVQNLKFSQKFSVISMMDVLEHVPYPKELLEAVEKNLEDGGVIVISMPNIESAVWKILNQEGKNPYWGELEHYHNFGRSRLYSLLEEFSIYPVRYGISDRYRACMEVIAIKKHLIIS